MASHDATATATVPEMAPVFHPIVWGDFFINYNPEPLQMSEERMTERSNQLKEKIIGLFSCGTIVEQLNLVDTLQHLSVDHHFHEKIDSTLRSAHAGEFNSSSLHHVVLRFRILRQQGFWVSPEHNTNNKLTFRWWKNLYREVGLNYSRDRVVECYFWAYTAYYEKEYTRASMILAKIIAIIIMTDDTYDVRATLVECRQWEESATSFLPEYLQKFYLKLMSTFKEFEDELKPDNKYRVAFSTKAFQILSSNYLQEAEWFHQNHKPRFNDQVKVSSVCSGGPWICVGLLVGMGDAATKEALEWALGCTDAVRACAEVTRFMNDLASLKRGKNKNDVASSVECYISEQGVASEVAIAKIGSLIEDAWKTTNQAHFELPELLLPAVQRVANITISMPFMYDNKTDAFTFSSRLEGTIKRLFVNPIKL
ncbi:tau-cadinol synthase-like [Triticum aestivum]|uniref:tau-cadinol synthase-like n=1 Tax=Triticum aestivum TaxID=4565 RepID=UPI001D02DF3D|nr:tau-cadinol synthase-like [Triticum aestivum]